MRPPREMGHEEEGEEEMKVGVEQQHIFSRGMTLDLLLLFLFRWPFLTERGLVTKIKGMVFEPCRRAYSAGRKKGRMK